MMKTKTLWECQSCGFSQSKWTGSCPKCQNWNTFVQQMNQEVRKRFQNQSVQSKPQKIREISSDAFMRKKTHMRELDRLLGGGIVEGALTLIAGAPGIGKSTLMLQVANQLSSVDSPVLYICGEESLQQTSLRAKRLGVNSDHLFLLHETSFDAIRMHIEQVKPKTIFVDSIQILYKNDLPSAPGSLVQVREITTEFMHLAKGFGISIFLVGHITKSGEIAGPRVLEHLVDTVLEFEGDRHHGFRLLRAIKNRFGTTDDITLFQMKESGLEEVLHPSEVFLQEKISNTSGSAIAAALEGIRAFLVEIQALVTISSYPTPSRRCIGLDSNRLALLLAVLEKRVGYQLHKCDVFVSLAGGMRILEPALDLAILLALASSFSNKIIDSKTFFVGEVGLNGEIRSVSRIESRLKEAIQMGFQRCILPKKTLRAITKNLANKIELIGAEFVDDAIEEIQ